MSPDRITGDSEPDDVAMDAQLAAEDYHTIDAQLAALAIVAEEHAARPPYAGKRTVRDGIASYAKYPDEHYDGMSDLGDVNPICGCHKRQRCVACSGCTGCDGCYCDEG